jgi:hypothetical protein
MSLIFDAPRRISFARVRTRFHNGVLIELIIYIHLFPLSYPQGGSNDRNRGVKYDGICTYKQRFMIYV